MWYKILTVAMAALAALFSYATYYFDNSTMVDESSGMSVFMVPFTVGAAILFGILAIVFFRLIP